MSNLAAPTILAISAGIPRGAFGLAVAATLTGITVFLLLLAWPVAKQTTLIGPWLWCLGGVGGLGLVEIALQRQETAAPWLLAARFIAGALTLCPSVAVLGAKRPQNRAWIFVVLALWGIISLASMLSLVLGRGTGFQLADLRGAILWILILLPALNYVPTRFVWGSLLVVLGEVILFAENLPLLGRPLLETDPGLVSLGCFAAAAFVIWTTPAPAPRVRHSLDHCWLAFRDLFGLFWGLRVQERVNAAAAQNGWPFYLSWSGFRDIDHHRLLVAIPPAYERALKQTLTGLLRRFVSAAWIAAQRPQGID